MNPSTSFLSQLSRQLVLLACFSLPMELVAQDSASVKPTIRQSPGNGVQVTLSFLAAVTANPSPDHRALGGALELSWNGWAFLATGGVGQGGEYTSTLAAAMVGRRLARVGRLSLTALVGAGSYAEKSPPLTRRAIGLSYGGQVRFGIGSLSGTVMVTDLTGHYDGADVSGPLTFHVLRYGVGLGVTLGR